jgi:hypothetical protein
VGSGPGRMDKDEIALREEDKRATNKREKAFTRLRKSLSSRGQRIMEKMGAGASGDSDQQLSRSSSRDNLSEQAKIPGSERISRSTSHLADIRGSQAGHGPNAFHP